MAGHSQATGLLGIEGGGTKTTWVLLEGNRVLREGTAGPGNTILLDDAGLMKLFRTIRKGAGAEVDAIGGAFAGCKLEQDRVRVEKLLRKAWPKARVVRTMEDTRSLLVAAFGDGPGIGVIAGTGSNVAGQRSSRDEVQKVGGWGHLFSDRGSAYALAREGLVHAYDHYDQTGKVSTLGREYLSAFGRRSLEELVEVLLRDTSKAAVAQGSKCVFAAAKKGDRAARRLLDEAVMALARDVRTLAGRMRFRRPQVALVGGLFENQPDYLARFQRALRKTCPGAKSFLLTVPGVFGAARLAGFEKIPERTVLAVQGQAIADPARMAAFAQASTEQRNPRSRGLDRRSIPQLVDLFIREERQVEKALAAQRQALAAAATLVAQRLCGGGRLFYLGAGTSGRLGVVDASEMPPTFNAPPEQVQAIIAGAAAAVFQSQEGAEDARDTGVAELKARGLTRKDVVCGIAASGQTPFVLAALDYARDLGAGTILLTCNPRRSIRVPVEVEIDLPTGPELVTGSTRLKAGTATKLVLNMLSTIAMVRLGRVQDNLMVNVQATNDKLRARAVRLVQALTGRNAVEAQAALEAHAWRVTAAAEVLKRRRKQSRGKN